MQFDQHTPEAFKNGYHNGERRAEHLDTMRLSTAVRGLREEERLGILTTGDTGYLRALEHALKQRCQAEAQS